MIHSFSPVIDGQCRVLVLGSMPSVVSLERQQYYGHKQNYFWPMLFSLLEEPYSDDYSKKKDLLLRHHIALWDVLASCEREGSLDSNITDEVPNPIGQLLTDYPSIRYILFNGGKAYQSFKKYFPDLLEQIAWQQMPSTSPAHTMKREEKRNRWQMILPLCK
ncbi:MAG: DNA-deoxyinosine glycosylase [Peptococcaceae bacterium]